MTSKEAYLSDLDDLEKKIERAALRYLDSAPSSRVFSFRLAEPSLSELGQITESYLCTRLERGFSTLDFYKSLFL